VCGATPHSRHRSDVPGKMRSCSVFDNIPSAVQLGKCSSHWPWVYSVSVIEIAVLSAFVWYVAGPCIIIIIIIIVVTTISMPFGSLCELASCSLSLQVINCSVTVTISTNISICIRQFGQFFLKLKYFKICWIPKRKLFGIIM